MMTPCQFPRHWPFFRGIHQSPSLRSVTRSFDVFFPLICAWSNGWANNRYAGHLRSHGPHYGVIVMVFNQSIFIGHKTVRILWFYCILTQFTTASVSQYQFLLLKTPGYQPGIFEKISVNCPLVYIDINIMSHSHTFPTKALFMAIR